MTTIVNGTTGLTFPDGVTQSSGIAAPGASGNLLTSNGTIWTSAAAPAGGFSNIQVFASSGTFTVPAGITKVKVTVVGGGGGGGGFTVGGGAGGTSSFGAFCSATAGNGTGPATNYNSGAQLGTGGIGTGGDFNIRGNAGPLNSYAVGGVNIFAGQGRPYSPTLLPQANSGAGGNGVDLGCGSFSVGGPAGGVAIKIISGLTSGGTVSVTVGGGGSAGSDGASAGATGVVVVEY